MKAAAEPLTDLLKDEKTELEIKTSLKLSLDMLFWCTETLRYFSKSTENNGSNYHEQFNAKNHAN